MQLQCFVMVHISTDKSLAEDLTQDNFGFSNNFQVKHKLYFVHEFTTNFDNTTLSQNNLNLLDYLCSHKRMVMHYLLFTPIRTACFVPHFYSLVMDNAEIYAKQGHQVDILYCDGKAINRCFYNYYGDKRVCKGCQMLRKYLFSYLTKTPNIRTLPISEYYDSTIDYSAVTPLKYASVEEIKSLEYKHSFIGYAALSTYLTITRNLFPLIDDEFQSYFNGLLIVAARLTDIAYCAIDRVKPDWVGVFNSRLVCCRPIVDVSKYLNQNFVSYEVRFDRNNKISKQFYVNSTPHNIETNTKMINDLWESQNVPTEEKRAIAQQFFDKRRNAIAAADKVYIAGQQSGLLPDDWDKTKHNIVIYNSSEDEVAALGTEYTAHALFSSQYQGIKYTFEKYRDRQDIHFYLRIHPNLKNVPYQYHKKLYELGSIKNVTVIPGDSPVSTYTLMDNADKIIVFGTTVGFEAAFAHKPVILLSESLYRYLDITYVAQTIEEYDKLICDKTLQAKDNLGAYKLAYYLMNDEFAPFEYYTDHEKKVYHIVKDFVLTRCMLKGSKISVYNCYLLQTIGKFFYDRSNRNIPEKEAVL